MSVSSKPLRNFVKYIVSIVCCIYVYVILTSWLIWFRLLVSPSNAVYINIFA